MKKFALIWCSDNMLLEYRDYMLGQLSDGTGQWDVLSPADPNFAEQVKDYDGYVISGSEKSVVDDLDAPLTQRLFAFIRDVRATSAAPVVGICFGAQALAAALDCRVGRNESGQFRLGVESLKWLSPSITQQWPEITDDITLVQSHGECVLKLPPDSVLLASSPSAAHEIFLAENRFLAIQGHPESDASWLRKMFMPFHRDAFDQTQWEAIEHESTQPVNREGILALIRRLLKDGHL